LKIVIDAKVYSVACSFHFSPDRSGILFGFFFQKDIADGGSVVDASWLFRFLFFLKQKIVSINKGCVIK